jgi:hypothetical protein
MADIGGSQSDAFMSGVNHQTVGRANTASITLGDAGLQAESDHWNAMTPRTMLASTVGGSPDDSVFERVQRGSGYQPGQMPVFQDQLSSGSDSTTR